MDINFRKANLNNLLDSNVIIELLNLFSIESNQKKPISQNAKKTLIQNLIKFNNSIIYLAEYNKSPIGIAVCFKIFSTFKSNFVINIHDFYIKKNYQNKGVGSKFLNYIERDVLKQGFCRITLEVYFKNTIAQKLYEKNGFIGNKNDIMYSMSKDLL